MNLHYVVHATFVFLLISQHSGPEENWYNYHIIIPLNHLSSKHQLVAIMFTDIAGYTAMMRRDEQLAVRAVKRHKEVIEDAVEANGGEVIQYYGDGSLSIFRSATDAIHSAMKTQQSLQNGEVVPLRIGIHLGEILIENDHIYGDGVNLASRIESLGTVGSILFSRNVYEQIRNNDAFQAVSLGNFKLKNIEHPVEVFALANPGFVIPSPQDMEGKGSRAKQKTTASVVTRILRSFGIGKHAPGDTAPQTTMPNTTPAASKSIAVLPFDNYSNIPEQQYLVDGITDEIRNQLLGINDLKVISRSSSKYCKSKHMSLRQIGQELEVEHVLDGSVQRLTDEVKISVELSNTRTDKVVWSLPPFKQRLEDVYQLENEIARQIVGQLKLELSEEEKSKLAKVPSHNAEAVDLYRRGQELLTRSSGKAEELLEAEQMFKTAVELDPQYDRAYAALSETYIQYIYWGRLPPVDVLQKALKAATRALELAPNSGASHGALGAVYLHNCEKNRSEKYFKKAIKLSPSYIEAYGYLAFIRAIDGEFEEAEKLLYKALELDPLSTRYLGDVGEVYYVWGRFEEGIELMTKALDKFPGDNYILWVLGYLYTGNEEYEKAIETFTQRSAGKNTNWMLAYAYAKNGQRDKAIDILNFQLKKSEDVYVPNLMIAAIYKGLGDTEKALDRLEADARMGGKDFFYWILKYDPKYADCRDHPRFQKLLDNMFKESLH